MAFGKIKKAIAYGSLLVGMSFALMFSVKLFWRETHPVTFPHFATSYPQTELFQAELISLREKGALSSNTEIQIRQSVAQVARRLEMPEALLGCLLFQESRLNHLAGYEGYASTAGLGQFSPYSLFEVNQELGRYHRHPARVVSQLLGTDVRPIEARRDDIFHPSSFFNIRTAVATAGLYLKNRKIEIDSILEDHQIQADPEVTWLWAAMGYNKGTRSILSVFNQLQRKGGKLLVERAVTDVSVYRKTTDDVGLVTLALRRIWDGSNAERYAREFRTHGRNIQQCSWGGIDG